MHIDISILAFFVKQALTRACFALPSLTAVIVAFVPLVFTVATPVSDDVHVSVLFEALDGEIVAVMSNFSPSETVFDVGLTDTPVMAVSLTVTTQVPYFPFGTLADIVVDPALIPLTVTVPSFTVTVAMLLSAEDHDVFLSSRSALFGVIAHVSVKDSPTLIVFWAGVTVTAVTSTFLTVTEQVDVFLFAPVPIVAVTTAVPTFFPDTFPPLTVTILSSEELH